MEWNIALSSDSVCACRVRDSPVTIWAYIDTRPLTHVTACISKAPLCPDTCTNTRTGNLTVGTMYVGVESLFCSSSALEEVLALILRMGADMSDRALSALLSTLR